MIALPESIALAGHSAEAARALLAAQLKPLHAQAFAKMCEQFEATHNAKDFVHDLAAWTDRLVTHLYEAAAQVLLLPKGICVMAVGGYGRGELFPYSDIDLAVLADKKSHAQAEALAGFIVPVLWDLGLTAAQSLRTVDETIQKAQADITVRTTLLDARHLAGDKTLYDVFQKAFRKSIDASSAIDFVEGKLAERDLRHRRWGEARFVLEPNIKEGKGGLRDLHTLYWLARYIYRIKRIDELVALEVLTKEELKAFKRAEGFLWEVRTLLHVLAGRAEERLTFDLQRTIAEMLGYKDGDAGRAVEQFMKKYYQTATIVGSLTRSICAVLEEEKKRKPRLSRARTKTIDEFVLDGERLGVPGENFFAEDPVRLVRLFAVAHREALDIHPRALQLVSRNLKLVDKSLRGNEVANNALMEIMLSKRNPEATLRHMKEAGVLGRFIPDFGRVIGQMQFDMYHVFTVDEHTLIALGILHGIGEGRYEDTMPISTRIWPLVKSRRVLFLALLCHDIAKGRGGDHSLLGEEVGRKLAERFGFDAQEVETVAWLIKQHLLMSRTAFKRDLNDPKTIEDFVAIVQSPERLRLLLLLTVADIRAVGPTVWNGWKGALLRELYYQAEAAMGAADTQLEQQRRHALLDALKDELGGWSERDIQDYLDLGSPGAWMTIDAPTHARIARMLKTLPTLPFPLTMDTRPDAFRAITDVIVCTPDQHGLFSKISGAMALTDLNIAGAKIFTLKNGIVVDRFQVQDIGGVALEKPERIARLAVALEQVLSGELSLQKEFAKKHASWPSRFDAFKVPPRVFIDNQVSANHTVIEVGGRDRIGFLYGVTRALSDLGLTIVTAHITTYGERAVDVFYVKDVFGMKIHHEGKIRQVREALMQVLSGAEKTKKAG